MKVLIVAHPDDEILWFNPAEFDRIVIVFCARPDKPEMEMRRKQALNAHPLRDRITNLGLVESNFWRDKSKHAQEQHERNRDILCARLKDLDADIDSVTTHSAGGEYGHLDHILVHNACMDALTCAVNGKDPVLYRTIRRCYEEAGCWTW